MTQQTIRIGSAKITINSAQDDMADLLDFFEELTVTVDDFDDDVYF